MPRSSVSGSSFTIPLLTSTFASPASLASRPTSRTYS